MSRVGLIKGKGRYDNVFNALKLIANDVEKLVSKSYRIVIVPNFLYPKNEATVSNVDASRAVLDFITRFTNKPITIASSSFSLADVFSDYHFLRLQDSYSVRFLDLQNDEFQTVKAGDDKFEMSKTLLNSDCLLSIGLLQTHNILLANLSLSQLILSALPLANMKQLVEEPKAAHRLIATLSKTLMPHMAIIDGFTGVQGDFPLSSNILPDVNLALAGMNPVAVDNAAASVMGIIPAEVAYLKKTGRGSAKAKIEGDKISSVKKKFVLPSNSSALFKL